MQLCTLFGRMVNKEYLSAELRSGGGGACCDLRANTIG